MSSASLTLVSYVPDNAPACNTVMEFGSISCCRFGKPENAVPISFEPFAIVIFVKSLNADLLLPNRFFSL